MPYRALCTVTGIVEAPPERVAALLTEVHAGPVGPGNAFTLHRPGRTPLVLRGGPDAFTAPIAGDPGGLHVEVDRDRNLLATHGNWWFGSECEAVGHPDGTRVEQRVLNRADGPRRLLVPLVSRGALDRHRAEMHALLPRLGEALGCRARVVDATP